MAKTKTDTDDADLHQLTEQEISEKRLPIDMRRIVVTNELAELYRARQEGKHPDPVISERDRGAREVARNLLKMNGATPAYLQNVPTQSREAMLLIERDGIDIALKILDSQSLRARAIRAVQYAEQHRPRLEQLYRQAVLLRAQLEGVVAEMVAIRHGGRRYFANLGPLAQWPESLTDPVPGFAGAKDALQVAVEAGIVSRAEIDRARQIEGK